MTGTPTVAVIGLGLIGGSMARALSANGVDVIAYDRNAASIDAAISEGVVERAMGAQLSGIREAEIIVIALPGDAARELIRASASSFAHAMLIMDVGSAKQLVIAAAEAAGIGERFVGCHPLAGDHRSGWPASRADMFQGHRVFLCPSASTSDDTLRSAQAFWKSLGSVPIVADAAAHDSHMAWISHLPHIISSSLALTLRDASLSHSELGPGGRDMTRLAGSSPEMWTAIAHENAEAITRAISAFEERLSALKNAVTRRDAESFQLQFSAGSAWSSET